MRIVTATFVNNEVEPGWPIMGDHVPLGKRYRVDLDDVVSLTMGNRETGRAVPVDCIYVVEPAPGGYLPLIAFRIEPDV